jgi:phage gp36-like protein
MPYATAQDMIDQIDNRWLFQLVLDNNIPATEAQFLASVRVEAALSSAAGRILASALQGKRYTKAVLDGLTGDGLALLVWLNVQLAAGHLASARQIPAKEMAETLPTYGEAQAFLQQLQLGNVIFDVDANALAGIPYTQPFCSPVLVGARRMFGNVARSSPCCPPNPCDPPGGCC